MRNLYIFAIGGSGERIFHSFLMLAAGGMQLNIQGRVHPIFIDTDSNAKSLIDVQNLLNEYRKIRANLYDTNYADGGTNCVDGISKKMFSVDIENAESFVMPGAALNNLSSLIEDSGNEILSEDGKAELEMLYDQELLQMPLDYGFVGVPSLGSVALNYILESNNMNQLLATISPDDGIYIIGSINGGTGAAGLPLLLNKFKLLKGATINQFYAGALSLLPYFKFDDGHAITPPPAMADFFHLLDATTFDAKTKAALSYYANRINGLSAVYFLGVPENYRTKVVKAIGGPDQSQTADYIEVIAARSVFHFADSAPKVQNENAIPEYYQYSLINNSFRTPGTQSYCLSDIPDSEVARCFVRSELYYYIVNQKLSSFLTNTSITYGARLGVNAGNTTFLNPYRNLLKTYFQKYQDWKDGLKQNTHGIAFDFVDSSINSVEETKVMSKFIPSLATTHLEGVIGFRHEEITDPGIINFMNNVVRSNIPQSQRLKTLNYSIEYSIEKILNDPQKSKIL